MKDSLTKKQPLLCLLSAIGFLLIYISGDKISVFNFMLIPSYLLMIINGQTGILGLNIHPAFNLLLDVFILVGLIYALYILFKAGTRGKYISKSRAISALIILMGFGVFQTFKVILTIPTILTLATFFILAIITLLTLISEKVSKQEQV